MTWGGNSQPNKAQSQVKRRFNSGAKPCLNDWPLNGVVLKLKCTWIEEEDKRIEA